MEGNAWCGRHGKLWMDEVWHCGVRPAMARSGRRVTVGLGGQRFGTVSYGAAGADCCVEDRQVGERHVSGEFWCVWAGVACIG